ncbi:chloride channel protein 3 [Arthroderma uncinatum]|uniref:chloride channel protein 3 n=1 Tax=Arthroderma uncinatum TaxID=74035 RepID=UPI00144A79C7|nr:chloride channel protein 3 [Arthroderma uncinatum]KAF3482736.1 chloride channel protein 3 [Arthroderma uncinatum]
MADTMSANRADEEISQSFNPIEEPSEQLITFKRRQKPPSRFGLHSIFGSTHDTSFPRHGRHRSIDDDNTGSRETPTSPNITRTEHHASGASQKPGAPLDWYIEGPGRRVGYDNLTAIDWIFEYTKERQRIRHLNSNNPGLLGTFRHLLDASKVWLVLVMTGLAVGLLAGCIDIASRWLADIKVGYCRSGAEGGKFYLNRSFCCWGYEDPADCLHWIRWQNAFHIHSKVGGFIAEYTVFILYSIMFATSAAILVTSYATHAKHSGIPEIKTVLGGFVIKRFMGLWTLMIKSVGLQLSYYFPDKTMWQSFVCAMAAAISLRAVNPFRTGNIVLYQVTYSRGWHRIEIVPFMLLGILGGLYGGLFIKLNMKVSRWRKARNFSFPVIEVIAVALLTGLINFPNSFMKAQLSELLHSLFAECAQSPGDEFGLCKSSADAVGVIGALLFAAILGFFLASITFGLDIPAGVILPSLAIGALYGRALGIAVDIWQKAHPNSLLFGDCEPGVPCVTPGTYAIIGAAAALGGATRMTVSIVVIMFELTGALTHVIPIMIAVMLSKWCGDIFGKRGIYESWIQLNEYPFLDQKDDTPPPDVPVSQVMTGINDLTVITAVGHTIESLKNLLSNTPYRGFPVVSDMANPTLLGYVSRNELSYALKVASSRHSGNLSPETQTFFSHQPFADPVETLDLRPWMDQTPITLNLHANFQIVLNMFQRLGLRYVLIVNRGRLEGFLTKKDIWYILNEAKPENGSGLGGGILRAGGLGEEGSLLARNNPMLVSPVDDGNML